MKINYEPKLDFDDVLLVPQRSKAASRKEVELNRNFSFYHSDRVWSGIPIFAANMDTTGTVSMSNSLSQYNMPTCLHKHYTKQQYPNLIFNIIYQWFSIGIKNSDYDKLRFFIDETNILPNICIDVANGYTDDFVNFCAKIRKELGNDPIIMAGNVCTPEMVQEIILHGGVDIVKVGIGPGSACTTRLKTGVGLPQLSAIIECSHAAHGLKSGKSRLGLICADGGCRNPSDVCKAFSAGADFVMLGGILAGTEECEGEWEYEYRTAVVDNSGKTIKEWWQPLNPGYYPEEKRKKSLKFYGMSSHNAQEKYGGVKDYRASEGRTKTVQYKGPASVVIEDILGGLRSACAYIGSTCLKDMNKCAEFNVVNRTHFDQSV
jgi:GMP reductase